MTDLQQALDKFDLTETSQAAANDIVSIVTNAYTNSAKFRQLLDDVPSSELIKFVPGSSGNFGGILPNGQRVVLYDYNQISNNSSIGSDGKIFNWTSEAIFIHEMIHAMIGQRDPDFSDFLTPNTDYVGPIISREQTILGELGYQDIRNSYAAVLENADIASLDLDPSGSLTLGNAVDLVLVDERSFEEMDLSDRIDTLLLVGLDGADVIKGGMSNDYIYGGDGADILMGHRGTDRLFGNDGDDILVGGSGAPIDPAALNLSSPHPEWDDNVRDYLSGGDGADTYVIYSDRTYFGGPSGWAYMETAFNNHIDFIDGKDTDFDAYFQFKYGNETKSAHITAQDLQNLELVEFTDNLYDLGVEVTFDIGGEDVTTTVMGEVIGGSLLLTIAFPGNEEFAILGGVFDFTAPANGPAPQNLRSSVFAESTAGAAGADMFIFSKLDARLSALDTDVLAANSQHRADSSQSNFAAEFLVPAQALENVQRPDGMYLHESDFLFAA